MKHASIKEMLEDIREEQTKEGGNKEIKKAGICTIAIISRKRNGVHLHGSHCTVQNVRLQKFREPLVSPFHQSLERAKFSLHGLDFEMKIFKRYLQYRYSVS